MVVLMLLEEMERHVPGGKRYSSIQSGLGRREAFGIVSGREMCCCFCCCCCL